MIAGIIATTNFWIEVLGKAWAIPMMLAAFLIGGFGSVGLIESAFRSNPFNRERNAYLISRLFERRWQDLHKNDPCVRVNIMLASWAWRPWPRRVLRVIERLGFADDAKDRHLSLRVDQGVAGVAFRNEEWAMGIRTRDVIDGKNCPSSRIVCRNDCSFEDMDQGLDSREKEATKALQFICSYPIRSLRRGGDGDKAGLVADAGKVIGVINVDSTSLTPYFTRDATGKLSRTAMVDELVGEIMPDLAKVTGYIFG